jgi:hypothetical protein
LSTPRSQHTAPNAQVEQKRSASPSSAIGLRAKRPLVTRSSPTRTSGGVQTARE